MKLSEAIRLGAMLHPQCFYKTFDIRDGETLKTCAIGAAVKAGYDGEPWLVEAPCPACRSRLRYSNDVHSLVAHLNDDHRWTRETIADWVETIEPADERREASRTADAVARSVDLVTV